MRGRERERARGRERERERGREGERERRRSRTRGREKERVSVLNQVGASIYVNNLPQKLDKYGLRGIFSSIGEVVDSYIPRRIRIDARPRYGFVRFTNAETAIRSIQKLNNKVVRGHKIAISIAKSSYSSKKRNQQQEKKNKSMVEQRRVWRKVRGPQENNMRQAPLTQQNGEPPPISKSVTGKVNADFMPWLSTSLVCSSPEPRDVATLANAIISGYGLCKRIYALSGYKFILTYQSEEEMEAALQHPEELKSWFSEIKRWDKYEHCTTRQIWLEVIGVSPHGWLWENFKSIAELWGCLICLGKPIMRTDSFVSMKMLIETEVLSSIDEAIVLMVEDMGFRVHVKEAQVKSMIVQEHKKAHFPHNETVESTGSVPGFEDVEKSAAKLSTPINFLGQNSHDHANVQLGEVNHMGSKSEKEKTHQNIEDDNDGTTSQTKTAQFSRNANSYEVIKKASEFKNHTHMTDGARAEVSNVEAEEESPREPPGFEKQNNNRASLEHGSQVDELHGSSKNAYEQSITATRQRGGNPQSSNPLDRYEAIAQEALNIGEMLGLKVVSSKENAVLNLAESMRVQNKKRTSTKQPVRAEISLN